MPASPPGKPMRRRRVRRIAAVFCVIALILAVTLGIRPGDRALFPPADGAETVTIHLVSNGFHSGLVLPRAEMFTEAARTGRPALLAVGTRFAHYGAIEFGWGEARFYRATPTIASIDWRLALAALFRPGNTAVMHVVGVDGDPVEMFAGSDVVRIPLSVEGFARLVGALDRSFARGNGTGPVEQGPGLYGPSLFFSATGAFSFANLCNHWTARMLDAAGVPTSPLLATVPRGILWDLRLRSGLRHERDAGLDRQGLGAPTPTP